MENCNNTIFLETFIYNVEKKITETSIYFLKSS